MKRIIAILFVLALAFTMTAGCVTDPVTGKKTADWLKISAYFHKYVIGLIAPIGETAAAILAPQAAPLIALADRQVTKLDTMIAAKATGAALNTQTGAIIDIINDINATVGQAKAKK